MKLRITVEGKTYDVDVEVLEDEGRTISSYHLSAAPHVPAPVPHVVAPTPRPVASSAAPVAGGKTCQSPIAGTVFKILVKPGDAVALNQPVIVLEAMKMETPVSSPAAGTVREIRVSEKAAVKPGDVLLVLD